MKFKCIVLVISVLIIVQQPCKCDDSTITTTESTDTEKANATAETTTEPITTTEINNGTDTTTKLELNRSTKGLYGGSYCNYSVDNFNDIHYIHGVYQVSRKDYYPSKNYTHEEKDGEALDYYLGFGLSKMTDKNFKYEDFHHFYHDLNRSISENETIRMDLIIACHPNATFLCPENTETVCLLNGTIYCMSRISVTENCAENETMLCVKSMVPCVKDCVSTENYLEKISMPCLATVVTVDVYEDRKGMTISKVGGTFILVPALKIEDRLFCVTVIVDPVSDIVNGTETTNVKI